VDKPSVRVNIGAKRIVLPEEVEDHSMQETENNAIVRIRAKTSQWSLDEDSIDEVDMDVQMEDGTVEDHKEQSDRSLFSMRRTTADRLAEALYPPPRLNEHEHEKNNFRGEEHVYKPSNSELDRPRPRSIAASVGLAIVTGTLLGMSLFSFYKNHEPTGVVPISSPAHTTAVAKNSPDLAQVSIGGDSIYEYQVGSFNELKAEQAASDDLKNKGFAAIEGNDHPYQLVIGAALGKLGSDSFKTLLEKDKISYYLKAVTVPSETLTHIGITDPNRASQIGAWIDAELALADQLASSPDTVDPSTMLQQLASQSKMLTSFKSMGTTSAWTKTFGRIEQLQSDLLSGFDSKTGSAQGIDQVEHALAKFYIDRIHLSS